MRKLTSALLIICILASCCLPALAAGKFSDVAPGIWYADAVDYVVKRKLFDGVSDTLFDPSSQMTRGMFMTVLGRMANVPNVTSRPGRISRSNVNLRSEPTTDSRVLAVLPMESAVSVVGESGDWYQVQLGSQRGYVRGDLMELLPELFTDVPKDTYYAPYIQWAVQNDIVTGTSGSTFSPDAIISREQLCTVLYNFSKAYGIILPQDLMFDVFDDNDEINDWARDAVYTLRTLGVINGKDGNRFAPKAGATRAEVATIIYRFEIAVGLETMPNVGIPFGAPVPESMGVGDDYFDDACFIGHSMVVGMSEYFRLPNADYYAVNGISASGILDYKDFPLEETDAAGRRLRGTLAQALQEKAGEYKKIYILLGTNELGPLDSHLNRYSESMEKLIDLVRAFQPHARIYVLATYPVSRERSESDSVFNRENILRYNERLMSVSLNKEVYYLDTFSLLADQEGYLPEAHCARDGIHILGSQYAVVRQYLKTHVV